MRDRFSPKPAQRPPNLGLLLREFVFTNSEREKPDAEALQDWESEGGTFAHVDEDPFGEGVHAGDLN